MKASLLYPDVNISALISSFRELLSSVEQRIKFQTKRGECREPIRAHYSRRLRLTYHWVIPTLVFESAKLDENFATTCELREWRNWQTH